MVKAVTVYIILITTNNTNYWRPILSLDNYKVEYKLTELTSVSGVGDGGCIFNVVIK